MAPYRHLLLTRFNLEVPFAPEGQNLDDEWLRSRLEPFERFCLPSIQSQTADFTWLVLCDSQSPAWFKERLATIDCLTPVYFDGNFTHAALRQAIRDRGLADRPWLISTRLDSDDALARGHLTLVQARFLEQDRQWFAFPVGVQAVDGALTTVVWRRAGFHSLIERVVDGQMDTALRLSHEDIVRSGEPLQTIWGRPQWLQSLHETNTSSQLRGLPRWRRRDLRFACKWPEVGVTRRAMWKRCAVSTGCRLTRRFATSGP